MQSLSILLVCYSYPPYPGTGGRRWAKLSKYLAREGHKIHVINGIAGDITSVWQEDTIHGNIHVHGIRNNLEFTSRKLFLSKLTKKILFYLSKVKTNANYADQSLWWNDKALAAAKKILDTETIDYLIVSCPPYHPMFEFSSLKKIYPKLKLVLDYRDIWIILQNGKGFFSHLNEKRFEQEQKKELQAISSADCIFTVADEMSDSIRQKFNHKPIYTLTNGYDEEDFSGKGTLHTNYTHPGKINIVFAGSLVVDSNPYAIPFFNAIALIKKEHPDLYTKLHLSIFGSVNQAISKIINDSKLDCVVMQKPIESKSIGDLYKQFDYLLMFLNPYYTYAFISKFFDYLPVRKPIICISDKGRFSEYLEEQQLGRNFEINSVYNNLVSLLRNDQKTEINNNFNVAQYSYRQLAENLTKTLRGL